MEAPRPQLRQPAGGLTSGSFEGKLSRSEVGQSADGSPVRVPVLAFVGFAFSMSVFSAGLIERYLGTLQIAIPVGLIIVLILVHPRLPSWAWALGVVPALFYWMLVGTGWHPKVAQASGNLSEVLVIAPLGALVGMGLTFSPRWRLAFRQGYICAALLNAVLALYEFETTRRLISPQFNFQYNRATVFVQHPIVLGMLFSVAICFNTIKLSIPRFASSALLLAGVAATGSQGPLIAASMAFLVVVFPQLSRLAQERRKFILAVLATAIVGLGLAATYVWTPVLSDRTNDQYDNQYRLALYSFLPKILESHPFGYGFSGLPPGTYIIDSYTRGSVDAAVTVDAEPVLLAAEFGFVGLLAAVALAVFAIRRWKKHPVSAIAFLTLFVCGLTAAVHAWAELTCISGVLIGALARPPESVKAQGSPESSFRGFAGSARRLAVSSRSSLSVSTELR